MEEVVVVGKQTCEAGSEAGGVPGADRVSV
jgi:hypothetical protein